MHDGITNGKQRQWSSDCICDKYDSCDFLRLDHQPARVRVCLWRAHLASTPSGCGPTPCKTTVRGVFLTATWTSEEADAQESASATNTLSAMRRIYTRQAAVMSCQRPSRHSPYQFFRYGSLTVNLQLEIASSGGVLGYWTQYGKTTAQLRTCPW